MYIKKMRRASYACNLCSPDSIPTKTIYGYPYITGLPTSQETQQPTAAASYACKAASYACKV